jgi:hypothetical protein
MYLWTYWEHICSAFYLFLKSPWGETTTKKGKYICLFLDYSVNRHFANRPPPPNKVIPSRLAWASVWLWQMSMLNTIRILADFDPFWVLKKTLSKMFWFCWLIAKHIWIRNFCKSWAQKWRLKQNKTKHWSKLVTWLAFLKAGIQGFQSAAIGSRRF